MMFQNSLHLIGLFGFLLFRDGTSNLKFTVETNYARDRIYGDFKLCS